MKKKMVSSEPVDSSTRGIDCQVEIETMDPATVAALLVLICQKRRENVIIQFLILKIK